MLLQTALALAKKNIAVFPCRPRDKRPATEHGVLDASTDPGQIASWWQADPELNVAIACGSKSGLFAIDIDGLDAEVELRRLEAQHGQLPATVEVMTARGRHLYFKMPNAPLRNSASKVAPGVDVRGDGGYVLTAPSIHPSGRRYAWSVDSAGAIASAPEWLLSRITEPARGEQPTPSSEWRTLMGGVPEGRRDCSLAKLAGYLLRRYIDPFVALELVQVFNETRCTPPLPVQDVERIVNSIAGKELRRRGATCA